MKRITLLVLALVLVIGICGCEKKDPSVMEFSTDADMMDFAEGAWGDEKGGMYYIIDGDECFVYVDAFGLSSYFDTYKRSDNIDLETTSFDTFYDELSSLLVKCDVENSQINIADLACFTVLPDGSLKDVKDGQIYTKKYDVDEIKSFLSGQFKQLQKEYILELKYPDLLTAKTVQSDKYQYRGKLFIITGTAQLANYYNWDYSGRQYQYFCISITPTGGTISDMWYVYASRDEFEELHKQLENGAQQISLVAKTYSYNTSVDNMATLVDHSS